MRQLLGEQFAIDAAARKGGPASVARRDSRRRNGEVNEVQFGADAMRHELTCGKPYTNEAFDVFVMPRDYARRRPTQKRKAKRVAVAPVSLVQVRSTALEIQPSWVKTPFYRVSAKHAYEGRTYRAGEIDYFAVYIEPKKLWYIIPQAVVGTRQSITLYPNFPNSKGQFEKFKERWDLLQG